MAVRKKSSNKESFEIYLRDPPTPSSPLDFRVVGMPTSSFLQYYAPWGLFDLPKKEKDLVERLGKKLDCDCVYITRTRIGKSKHFYRMKLGCFYYRKDIEQGDI